MLAYSASIGSKMPESRQSKGGTVRAQRLSASRKKEIAKQAAEARWNKDAPNATHEAKITLGDLEIECAVLSDGRRVISERAMTRAFGGKRGGSHWRRLKAGGASLPVYLSANNYQPFIDEGLADALTSPIKYKTEKGNIAHGLEASLLPKVCNVFLKARDADELHKSQVPMSLQADIIMRGLAEVGIVALIDEATGFQRERASDALAKILEAFIDKELRPWVKTFPDSFYEQLFRLRGLDYPTENVRRPQYFGHLTNDIVYRRLAPAVLEELKKSTPKNDRGRLATQMHRKLTPEVGHPKLREHMSSVVTIMKLSEGYDDFIDKLDVIHPRYGDTLELPFEDD
ncbi:MAG: P63C domain-containing protein [Thalassospira sp.]|uniref:P63C domain-containing protein n=1 Tax=Thalassospira sp. TaxID=1912094 RepID=UPI003A893E6D